MLTFASENGHLRLEQSFLSILKFQQWPRDGSIRLANTPAAFQDPELTYGKGKNPRIREMQNQVALKGDKVPHASGLLTSETKKCSSLSRQRKQFLMGKQSIYLVRAPFS